MGQVKVFERVRQLLKGLIRRWQFPQETKSGWRRLPGSDADRIWIADDFDDPLPPEIQKYFE